MADVIFPGQTPQGTLGSTALPENMDLAIWQGDAQQYYIVFTGSDGTTPLDLTGCTAQAVIRASYTDPTQYSYTCTIVDPPTQGKVSMYMSSATSATIPAGPYLWNFQVTMANGDVRTYLAGDCTVYAEVDKPS